MGALPGELALTCLRPAAPALFTLKEKRSEFIAALVPASTPEEARAALDAVRQKHKQATHNCPAWRIGFPTVEELIDTPKAWKVVLNVEQEVLKFTSLWAEYASFDAGFFTENVPYAFHVSFSDCYGALRGNEWSMFPVDTKALFVALKQQWNEKWSSFERYAHYDFDSDFDKVKDWAVGVGYQYTPNLYFELAYNRVDAGDLAPNVFKKGDIIRFRTLLSF